MKTIMGRLGEIERNLNARTMSVGFVDGATYPDGTSVATVAVLNEYGIPENNQPPRPFFQNAINEHESEWSSIMSRGLLAGKPVDQILEVLGAVIKGDIQLSITQLVDPPLSPTTIALRKNAKLRAAQGKPVNDSNKPLVDTGTMLQSVSYEIDGEQADES